MIITDIFIKRPVLACVISLLILVLGLRSLGLLPVRQYPETQKAVITVSTAYTGADPSVIAGFITTPLENAIAQASGIDHLSSSSQLGSSSIEAHLRLNYDPNKALTEINTKVSSVLNQLPQQAQKPTFAISTGDTIDSMYIGFSSPLLKGNQITDYLTRIVQPKLQAVDGVQQAEILGSQRFAMRAWLDPNKLTAYHLTAKDVGDAIANNNFIAAAGRTDGQMVTVNLTTDTNLRSLDEFRNLVIKSQNGALVRLSDVANVSLGSDNYDIKVSFDGKSAVYIGIQVAPTANVLTVIDKVRAVFPSIVAQLPQGLNGQIVYDATKYINSSVNEVKSSLVEAMLIVTAVIFLFLGSLRSVLIPVIAIPLSLIGTFFVMLIFGYSINLLTLLALVLSIGLVVDDAIIVVENIHRHLEEGLSKRDAAIKGARELANPIIAITVVLIAVYVPIGFMGGLTGALFTEFAFTLAGAVTISAIVALTLSPMMCGRYLERTQGTGYSARFITWVDSQFERLRTVYERVLNSSLNHLPIVMVFAVLILTSIYFLYSSAKSELAPQEDQGILVSMLTAAPDATLGQTQAYSRQTFTILQKYPEMAHTFQIDGAQGLNTSIAGMVLKPWDERKRTPTQMQPLLQAQLGTIAGAQAVIFQPPALPGAGGGLPLQFIIGTTDNYNNLNTVAENFLNGARQLGLFGYIDSDLKLDKPETNIIIDRDKTAQLGLTMKDVGDALASMLGGGYINYFSLSGRAYQVIPQVERQQRLNEEQLLDYSLTTPAGAAVPLSSIAHLEKTVVPQTLNHFQQLNSAKFSAALLPHVTQGQALSALRTLASSLLPAGYSIDYGGESRQYMQESNALLITFVFALIIIFLALSALFESFRDPLIVLISVPMSICGAMIFINLGLHGASLNIYTEVGLVTLIGLISKHGILIVQFANDLQLAGHSKREAAQMAAGIRLRPILMTTASMVLGVLPLLLASGAGAVSRFNIGLVIASGLSIGTLFTLIVVPAMYVLLAETKVQVKQEPISST